MYRQTASTIRDEIGELIKNLAATMNARTEKTLGAVHQDYLTVLGDKRMYETDVIVKRERAARATVMTALMQTKDNFKRVVGGG